MPSVLLEHVATHLSFLGYKVSPIERDKKALLAEHPDKENFEFAESHGVVKFLCARAAKRVEDFDTTGYLTFINSLNLNAILVCFCKTDSNTLMCQAVFHGMYDKSSFSFFVQAWEHDTINQFREKYSEMCKYFW